MSRTVGKPGITKGGQIVMVSDAFRSRPRAYIHRHKLHNGTYEGWTQQGPLEVRLLMERIIPLSEGSPTVGDHGRLQHIFSERPHCTWDNFFLAKLAKK